MAHQSRPSVSQLKQYPAQEWPASSLQPSHSSSSLAYAQNAAVQKLGDPRSQLRTSRTWTSSSGDICLLGNDADQFEDRSAFVREYNGLAKKHGVRILVVEDFEYGQSSDIPRSPEKRGWFHRLLRSTSNNPQPEAFKGAVGGIPRHKRSVSDLAHNLVHPRREPPKTIDLTDMVRLSGKSIMYLPQEYSPRSLILPTCLRATAQHLAQNATTRGIFRIPGSVKIVNALFHYYCHTESGGVHIASTVRCTNLPQHIQASVHDVASTFKRLLSVLPGGILGSKALFDALVAIHSRLQGDPEFPRTKQTKIRARLIALAIGTVKSHYRRELICAVFGLLSLIGRVAEVTPREDEDGRPLPTGDLMGYGALGIVFGPLLLGELLDQYEMNMASPASGLLLIPHTPPRLRRGRRKSKGAEAPESGPLGVDKILVANSITEMLIANWRDVVRQMKSLGTHHSHVPSSSASNIAARPIQPSLSESFVIRKPHDWERAKAKATRDCVNHDESPEPETPTIGIKRQRPSSRRSRSSTRLIQKTSFNALSPTAEESVANDEPFPMPQPVRIIKDAHTGRHSLVPEDASQAPILEQSVTNNEAGWHNLPSNSELAQLDEALRNETLRSQRGLFELRSSHVALDDVPPRTSSKQRNSGVSSDIHTKLPFSSEEDVAESMSAKTRTSFESPGIKRSQWVNKRGLQHGSRSNAVTPEVRIIQTPKSSIESIRLQRTVKSSPLSAKSSRPAVEKQLDYPPHPDAQFSSDSSPDEGSSEQMSTVSFRQENVKYMQTSPNLEHESIGKQFRPDAHEPSHLHYRPINNQDSPRTREMDDRGSITATPQHFYAAMRLPPTLASAQSEMKIHQSPIVPTGHYSGSIVESSIRPSYDKNKVDGGIAATSLSRRAGKPKLDGLSWQESDVFEQPTSGKHWPENFVLSKEQSTARPSVAAAGSTRGAVKAMAAMWENQDAAQDAGLSNQQQSCTQSIVSRFSQDSPVKSLRTSRVGAPSPQKKTSWSSKDQQPLGQQQQSVIDEAESTAKQTLRASVSDSVALRAATLADAQKKQQANAQALRLKRGDLKSHGSPPSKKEEPESSYDKTLKSPPSLGTMVPPPELPPVAHHLNLPRPVSSPSMLPLNNEVGSLVHPDLLSPITRPTSTTLHAQIRNLQRQLDFKTDEAAQLRRQVEAQENSDIGTLSEQLREAKREMAIWRDRAEAAERRVKVFERFTARLRGIREAAAAADHESSQTQGGNDWLNQQSDREDETDPRRAHKNKHVEGRVAKQISEDSRRTEDAGVVTARIRKCLHENADQVDGQADGRESLESIASPNHPDDQWTCVGGDVNQSALEIWVAAQELLDLDQEVALRAIEHK
ncbi:hypothetical protein S40285_06744 [Stachybotrys chlorohalonatus IBT 40285]|uniref:Rho-GAP domain-containing protein n=1 Tax=Stachybotrys chlorohalonatus (strain IBT 40285) TaxID=1283841 RepID=A0A084QJW4_STAC4|nr:hypothetical protein S40285_06744 [Stachybotrys chlorohalonata IBT 40285]